MPKNSLAVVGLVLAIGWCGARSAWADAAGDLKAGRAALEAGELEQARPLLVAASQALPESVEAQLALAELHLKSGEVEPALEAYRRVLKLSPEHAQAKRVVESLTGQRQSFAQRIAAAKTLMSLGAWTQAEAVLAKAALEPVEAASRHEARLLLAQARLWNNALDAALADAVRLTTEAAGTPIAAEAQNVVLLALLALPEPAPRKALQLLLEAVDRKEADRAKWPAQLVELLTQLPEGDAADVSRKLAPLLEKLPDSPYRNALVDYRVKSLVAAAQARLGAGDGAAALAIVWPLISKAEVPGGEVALKPVTLGDGWLGKRPAAAAHWQQVGQVLAGVGRLDFERNGSAASLVGFWLAAETLRQTPTATRDAEGLLNLATELAGLSRPKLDRKPGTALSTADELAEAILFHAAERTANDAQRGKLAELVIATIQRYAQADELENGLNRFTVIEKPTPKTPGETVKLRGTLERLPPGGAQHHLLVNLAEMFSRLGKKAFDEAVARQSPDANAELARFDVFALQLYGQANSRYPNVATAGTAAGAIIERYAAAGKWPAAGEGMRLFYAPLAGDAGRWAAIRMQLRQAAHAEDKSLAANRLIGKTLPTPVTEALAEIRKLVNESPTEKNRQAAIGLLGPLVVRYVQLERPDLAEAVIAAMVDKDGAGQLADWAVWQRIELIDGQATRALAIAAAAAEDARTLPLSDAFRQEVELIGQLLTKHPNSDYVGRAVERVAQIAERYQSYRSFDAATKLLQDFLKTHPKLAAGPRLEFQLARIVVAKARVAFAERKDKLKPPAELSAEFVAAIDALAAFLKTHGTGEFAPAAEAEMLAIARTYGEASAWPVARQVLARFAAAVPDFRSPKHLKYLEAVTYLGELDPAHALTLLTPQPPKPAQAGDVAGLVAALDQTVGDELSKGDKELPQVAANAPAKGGAGSGAGGIASGELGTATAFSRPGTDPRIALPAATPSYHDLAIASIRKSEHMQLAQIAKFNEDHKDMRDKDTGEADEKSIRLPSGVVLSEAEMKRQDEAADKAYAILIELAKSSELAELTIAVNARAQIHWMFSFFESRLRADRTVALIKRYLKDQPNEPAKIALVFRSISDSLLWAGQRQPSERLDQAWVDRRHVLFDAARDELRQFSTTYADKANWANQARLLLVDSFDRESQLVAPISAVRAGGLLVQAANALTDLLKTAPEHPEIANFPARLWALAERLQGLKQADPAIFVLSQIPKHFPTSPQAQQAILRIAESYAAHLANPLRAVETYQEYLSLVGDSEPIRVQIFSIAQQLAAKQRYLEALHVFGVFVDSFPTDARAAEALSAIGHTHQANYVWDDAIKAYERILAEYPAVPIVPQIKLAVAECHINLSHWKEARKLYAEFAQAYPNDPQAALAKARMDILKNLDRYQTLLADDQVQRNKDDAQFQIGRIVLEQLQNPVKAIVEFRKVVKDYAKSDLADDAQFEIGKALLNQNKLAEAREELLKVPANFPTSPLADDALYLVGQSYERQGQRIAALTLEKARAEAFELGQRGAYQQVNRDIAEAGRKTAELRFDLKKAGKREELDLVEAKDAFRQGSAGLDAISASSRQAELKAETESAMQVANRQDRINESNRQAVTMYMKVANDYPLGDMTDKSLLRMAQIFETELKDRVAAMQTYQKVVKFFPGTPVAEDAAWKVATFHEQEGKFSDAVAAYREFIRNYPASGRVADAQFAMAESLEQLGRWVEAMDAYETFRQKFTGHPKAVVAQEQINWIKAYRK